MLSLEAGTSCDLCRRSTVANEILVARRVVGMKYGVSYRITEVYPSIAYSALSLSSALGKVSGDSADIGARIFQMKRGLTLQAQLAAACVKAGRSLCATIDLARACGIHPPPNAYAVALATNNAKYCFFRSVVCWIRKPDP